MSRSSRSKERGFTLAELLVSIAIVSVIMGIVLTSQSKYTEAALLNNTIEDASLLVREAQISGVSVRELQPGSGDFTSAYGAMFQKSLGYYFFADRGSRDGYYDNDASCPVGGSSECLSKKDVPSGLTMSAICSISIADVETCNIGRVDITFVRPEIDAHFVFWDTSLTQIAVANVKGVRIKFQTSAGVTRSIVVYTTGQISLQ